MARQTKNPEKQSHEIALFEALEALEKVKIHMLQQDKDKGRMVEEYARLHTESGGTDKENG